MGRLSVLHLAIWLLAVAACGAAHPRPSRGPTDLAVCEYGTGRTLCGTWTYDPASDTLAGDWPDFGQAGTLAIERFADGSVRLTRTDTVGRYLPALATYVARPTATGYEGTTDGWYRNDLGARATYSSRFEVTGRIPDPAPGREAVPPAGCRLVAVGGARFALCPDLLDRESARARCESHGWRLASFDDPSHTHVVAWLPDGAWIGATDALVEGTFTWTDGTTVALPSWCPGEPNESGNEDCVIVTASDTPTGGCWNDGTCDTRLGYICEAAPPSRLATPPGTPAEPPAPDPGSAPDPRCDASGTWGGMWWLSESHPDELTVVVWQAGTEIQGTLASEEGSAGFAGEVNCAAGELTLHDPDSGRTFRLELSRNPPSLAGRWSGPGGGGEVSLERRAP